MREFFNNLRKDTVLSNNDKWLLVCNYIAMYKSRLPVVPHNEKQLRENLSFLRFLISERYYYENAMVRGEYEKAL